ncbi:hypothetical protein [Paenibacillus sp. FSL R7-0272]|uniref:hypothetical protein n=1 Tax=Paenibacillus sp. FSL R7-0272 TaxID=2921679 RepID=UPI0030EBB10B
MNEIERLKMLLTDVSAELKKKYHISLMTNTRSNTGGDKYFHQKLSNKDIFNDLKIGKKYLHGIKSADVFVEVFFNEMIYK